MAFYTVGLSTDSFQDHSSIILSADNQTSESTDPESIVPKQYSSDDLKPIFRIATTQTTDANTDLDLVHEIFKQITSSGINLLSNVDVLSRLNFSVNNRQYPKNDDSIFNKESPMKIGQKGISFGCESGSIEGKHFKKEYISVEDVNTAMRVDLTPLDDNKIAITNICAESKANHLPITVKLGERNKSGRFEFKPEISYNDNQISYRAQVEIAQEQKPN